MKEINRSLKSAWLELVKDELPLSSIKQTLRLLNKLPIEQQNTRLNIATSMMSDMKTRGK